MSAPLPDPLDLVLLATLGRRLDAATLESLLARGHLPGMPSRIAATTLLTAWLGATTPRGDLPVRHAAPRLPAAFPHLGPGLPPWPRRQPVDPPAQEEAFAAHLWRLATEGVGEAAPTLPAVSLDLWTRAAASGWTTLAIQLLDEGAVAPADILASRRSHTTISWSEKPMPWLHALAWLGHADVLSAWLRAAPQTASVLDGAGRTPLFFASTPEIASALMAAGCSPDQRDALGKTALGAWSEPQFRNIPAATRQRVAAARREDAGERLLEWCNHAPPPDLKSSDLQAMVAWRITLPDASGQPRGWGPLAWLARNLRRTLYANTSTADIAAAISGWKAFAAALPDSWVTHESVPGLADGWLWMVAWNGLSGHSRLSAEVGDTVESVLLPGFDAPAPPAPDHPLALARLSGWVRASAELCGILPDAMVTAWLTDPNAWIRSNHAIEAATLVLEAPALAKAWLGGRRPALGLVGTLLPVAIASLSPQKQDSVLLTRFWNAALGLPSALYRGDRPGMQQIVSDSLEHLADAGLWPTSLASARLRNRLQALADGDGPLSFRSETAAAVRTWLKAAAARRDLEGSSVRSLPRKPSRRRA